MTVSADVIRTHIDYTVWATLRVLDAAGKLSSDQLVRDFGTADKSVPGTLVHIFRAERVWLGRIQVGSPILPWASPDDGDWSALTGKWTAIHADWKAWAARLSDADADRAVAYTDLKGNPWTQPLWQIVFHVVNHSTHHRGQVSGFLRSMGHVPPPLDFIAFMRQQSR